MLLLDGAITALFLIGGGWWPWPKRLRGRHLPEIGPGPSGQLTAGIRRMRPPSAWLQRQGSSPGQRWGFVRVL